METCELINLAIFAAFSPRCSGKMKEGCTIEPSTSPKLLYLTRCVWRAHFSARPRCMQMARNPRANTLHSYAEKDIHGGARYRFSTLKERYYYGRLDTIDLGFNGILVSGLPRVSAFPGRRSSFPLRSSALLSRPFSRSLQVNSRLSPSRSLYLSI